ncbi:MAG: ATP-dependent Clp protease adaptor ClpS [Bacteroidales bacterium]|nr:ATP-dependent Clp protease adaptor ClpS [Bacteroidales bacterium]
MVKQKTKLKTEKESLSDTGKHLVLYNDEHHTFEYVIKSLIEVCNHDAEQAEQCTMLTHYKGKCPVRTGSEKELRPFLEGLLIKGLYAEVE